MLRLDDEGEKRDLLDLELRAEQLGLTDKTDLVRFFFMDARSDRRLRPNDMKLMISWWDWWTTSTYESGPEEGTPAESGQEEGLTVENDLEDGKFLIDLEFLYKQSGSSYFVAGANILGKGRPETRVGDEILIAKGCRVPLCLRSLEEDSIDANAAPKTEKKYQFVGECYVHGMMDGQAVSSTSDWQTVHLH